MGPQHTVWKGQAVSLLMETVSFPGEHGFQMMPQ